jgi:hypothetical protein
MNAKTTLCCLLLWSGSLWTQAQTSESGTKTPSPARPEIQIIAHQGARSGTEPTRVAHAPEAERKLIRHWEMTQMTDQEGVALNKQNPEQRDRFRILADHSISVVKGGFAAEGRWKFNPESGYLMITDLNGGSQVVYTVLRVSDEELVLHYDDPLKGNKVLHFVPLP